MERGRSIYNTKRRRYGAEEHTAAEAALHQMASNPVYNTGPGSADNTLSFVDRHMYYLNTHPGVNPRDYLSNLRLMTKQKYK